jgi:TonB-linked SusC/RagA family outer membrane protein
MKLSFFIYFATLLQVNAASVAQRVSLDKNNASLKESLIDIQHQSGYSVFYDAKMLRDARPVNVHVHNVTLKEALDECFRGQPFTYTINEKTIVVTPPKLRSFEATVSPEPFVLLMETTPKILSFDTEVQPGITITGRVTDSKGAPLSGVSIKIKGSDAGTVSDEDGKYRIVGADRNVVLVFSYVGYATQEFLVGHHTQINVSLTEQLSNLSDVIVVGYNTQKRTNITGSMVAVQAKDIENSSVSDPLESLEGKTPGLRITQSGGQPGGEGMTLNIRGPNSFASDNSPLVLVNGVVGNISDLDPSFIESVTVLKDAASAAIYGARASNGVILVTTKKGTGDSRLSVQYNGGYIVQNRINMPKRVWNSYDYMNMHNTAVINAGGGGSLYGADTIALYKNPSDQYPSFNWENFMFHPINIVSHSLTIGGRTGNTSYQAAMGIWNQDGIVRGFNYKKYTGMFNLESQVNKRLKLGVTTNGIVDNQTQPFNGSSDEILATLGQLPDYKPTLTDGSGNFANRAWPFAAGNKNPLAAASAGGLWNTDFKFNGTAYARLNILDNLVWEVKGGMSYTENDNKQQTPVVPVYDYLTNQFYANLNDNSTISLNETNTRTTYYTVYSTLNYFTSFWKDYHLNVLAGVSQEKSNNSNLYGYRYGFASNNLDVISAGPSDGQQTAGDETEYALRSQFGKINLDYQNKYLLEGDFRRDGSSRFPPANKYAFFPSVSAGWRIAQENFVRKHVGWLSELKLRASYGELGNDNVNGNYPYQNVIGTGWNYPFSSLQGGVGRGNLANDQLKWEQTDIANIGLEYNVLHSLLYGSIDYFSKTTSGILRQEQIPGYAGVGSPYVNEGKVSNKGYEVVIGHKGHIHEFDYSAEFNISGYKNKLVKFGAPEYGTNMMKEGYEMNSYYMYQSDGIYQSQDEITKGPTPLYVESPGDVRIKDVDGDGKITPNDRVPVKGINPDYYFGLNLSASWKGFDMNIFFQGEHGQKVLMNGEYSGVLPFGGNMAPLEWWNDSWTSSNHSATKPIMDDYYGPLGASTRATTTFWLMDKSYMRLKHVSIGYTLPASLTKKASVSKLRVYVNAENLLTFTKFKFGDPETGGQLAYPMMSSLNFGLNVQF